MGYSLSLGGWTVSQKLHQGRVATPRICSTSRIGGAPKSRLYSRLKCEASSYPTRYPAHIIETGSESYRFRRTLEGRKSKG